MKNPEISPQTNDELRRAVARYSARVAIPCYLADVDNFAKAHLENTTPGMSTLVTANNTLIHADSNMVVVSIKDHDKNSLAFVNIDLVGSDHLQAAIVQPGFYDKVGQRAAEGGVLMRPVLRLLTEAEGSGLITDLQTIERLLPADRLRG